MLQHIMSFLRICTFLFVAFFNSPTVFFLFFFSLFRLRCPAQLLVFSFFFLVRAASHELASLTLDDIASGIRASVAPCIAEWIDPLKKDKKFCQTNGCQESFQELERRLVTALILCLPDIEKVFQVYCDASNHRVGSVLMQGRRVFAYPSRKLKKQKVHYPTLIIWNWHQ